MTDMAEDTAVDSGGSGESLGRPEGALLIRSAELREVYFPQRIVELIVAPYETEALVEHRGRMVRETIGRGAFDGIEKRPNRVKVNRDHSLERSVGKAVAFHPSRAEGLVAELKISDTVLGEETLTLAADGVLDASAGFLPMPGGEQWITRSRVRYSKCWLGHIALTPDPAYEQARVLAVRHASERHAEERTATPNLDLIRQWQLEEQYRALDR